MPRFGYITNGARYNLSECDGLTLNRFILAPGNYSELAL